MWYNNTNNSDMCTTDGNRLRLHNMISYTIFIFIIKQHYIILYTPYILCSVGIHILCYDKCHNSFSYCGYIDQRLLWCMYIGIKHYDEFKKNVYHVVRIVLYHGGEYYNIYRYLYHNTYSLKKKVKLLVQPILKIITLLHYLPTCWSC